MRVLATIAFVGLLLRIAMACCLPSVCDDAFYYIRVADSLGRGDYKTAFGFLSINVYPPILLLLHRLGLDWIVAAKLWGVAASTLLMLPLFGWVRRVFDESTALVSCFLYAVHPTLIELAVEPIRDPTFWCFFSFSLYLTRRGADEGALRWFALGGIAGALAVHTRVEGWCLLIPLTGWCLAGWRQNRLGLPRLTAGIFVWTATIPLFLMIANVVLIRGGHPWEGGRNREFLLARGFLAKSFSLSSVDVRAGKPPSQDGPAAPEAATPLPAPERRQMTLLRATSELLRKLVSTVEPLFVILLIAGGLVRRQEMRSSAVVPLFATASVILLAIGVRLVFISDINGRYFLTPFLIVLPLAAHGVRWLGARLFALLHATRFQISQASAAAAIAAVLALAGGIDALTTKHVRRSQEIALGQWLRDNLPPTQRIAADLRSLRVGYDVRGDLPKIVYLLIPNPGQALAEDIPDVLILSKRRAGSGRAEIVGRAQELGMRPATLIDAPGGASTEFEIFVRTAYATLPDVGIATGELMEPPR